jgi:PAS domain S-box-containing protein
VKVFSELFRKTRQLEKLNRELERRVAERTAELEASTARLLQSEQRRSLALAAGQMGSWDWDLVNGDWMWDEGQCRIFGVDPATFKVTVENVSKLVAPEDMDRLRQMLAEYTSGTASGPAFQMEFRAVRPDGEARWCYGTASPTLNENGQVVRVSGVTIDITERKRAEEHQLLLAREVDHRARNALAVVQAIVRLTKASNTQTYVSAVEGRIRALAQAHTLLSQSRWQGADVERLVQEELAPYRTSGTPKVRISGPSAFLPPDKAQTLVLALHELATNAAKYGALSTSAGEVQVLWHLEPGALKLEWTESGGPAVQPPTSQGFGTKIMNASIKHQIGGSVVMDWRPEGLRCVLTLPRALDDSAANPPAREEASNLVQLRRGSAPRLLLVEDEALVGMMMRDLLSDMGFFVAGPFCSIAEAMPVARSHEFDGAVLDLNLRGEFVYPLAERLQKVGVPFIFVTGYDQESVDPQFADVPMLQKPIAREALEEVLRTTLSSMPNAVQGGLKSHSDAMKA